MFTQSLGYPRTGTAKTILVGSLLTLLGVLVVPLVFVAGYTVHVVRAVLAGDERAPAFTSPRALFTDGLKAMVVGVAYFALPSLVIAGTGLAVLVVFDAGSTLLAGALALVGVAVAGALFLAGWYVGAAGFVTFAATGRLADAFAFGALWPVLTDRTYAVSWLLALGVFVASSVLSGALEALPLGVGTVLGAFVAFYTTVVISYLHARGVADARTGVPDPGRDEPATGTAVRQPAD